MNTCHPIHSDGALHASKPQASLQGTPPRCLHAEPDTPDGHVSRHRTQRSCWQPRPAHTVQSILLKTLTHAPSLPHCWLAAAAQDKSIGRCMLLLVVPCSPADAESWQWGTCTVCILITPDLSHEALEQHMVAAALEAYRSHSCCHQCMLVLVQDDVQGGRQAG